MKHSLLLGMLLAVATSSNAQDNHGYGAGDGEFQIAVGRNCEVEET